MKPFFFLQRFLLPFLLLVLASCARPGPDANLIHDAGTTRDGFPLRRVSESNDCYSLQIDYPVLNNGEIDRALRSWVGDKYDSTTGEFNKLCANVTPKQPFRLWVEYRLHSTPRTVSVVFESLIYAGGEQYHDKVDTLNFLWESGDSLDYADIFTSPEALEAVLAAHVGRSLEPELGEIWAENPEFAAALEPGRLHFENFAITGTGLVLYFPTRQLAPFYAGPQRCDVPLGRLSRLGPNPDIWK